MARIQYPKYRRLRQDSLTRELASEVSLSPNKLIQPLFAVEGISEREAIPGLSDPGENRGTFRDTEESLLRQVEADLEVGVTKFILFPVPKEKKSREFSWDFCARQIDSIKKEFGRDLWLATDVCLCSYTSHGHCGILNEEGNHLENAATTEVLAEAALAYAQAGADCVAPSDMMDGRVGAIRDKLDQNGSERTILMSYSAKFHSSFYGPFRVAADSAPKNSEGKSRLQDRSTYQIEPSRKRDAIACTERDLEEGADIVMVKPGLPYLDIVQDLSERFTAPLAVYQVSGEYAAIELMAQKGLMDRKKAHREAWTAFFRAGASMVISYGARESREIARKIK